MCFKLNTKDTKLAVTDSLFLLIGILLTLTESIVTECPKGNIRFRGKCAGMNKMTNMILLLIQLNIIE